MPARIIQLSLFLIIFFTVSRVSGQYQSPPVWIFGHNAGLDFTGGGATPTPIKSAVHTHSAVTATQCDASGKVMFYANGLNIYDKNGNVMANGQNPVWAAYTSSWSLQSIIVPDAGDTN